jgi:hypothetical protein
MLTNFSLFSMTQECIFLGTDSLSLSLSEAYKLRNIGFPKMSTEYLFLGNGSVNF